MTNQTPIMPINQAFGIAMPICVQVQLGSFVTERAARIPATGLSTATTAGTDVRDRKASAVKGHVALAAFAPGCLAWSPPIC